MSLFEDIGIEAESVLVRRFDYERALIPEPIVMAKAVVAPNPIHNILPVTPTVEEKTVAETVMAESPIVKKIVSDRVSRHDLFLQTHPTGILSTGQIGRVATPRYSIGGWASKMKEKPKSKNLAATKGAVSHQIGIAQGVLTVVDKVFIWINKIFPVAEAAAKPPPKKGEWKAI